MTDAREVFSSIYDTDHWRGGSGEGSTPAASAVYRQVVARLLRGRDVRSVVDVGCGDWQVGALIDWSGLDYVGVDVVPAVVDHHTATHARAGVRFQTHDAITTRLPAGDLLLAKDVLQHWPSVAVTGFLERELDRHRYVLLTNDIASVHYPGPVNSDTALGGWRTLDLAASPFGQQPAWSVDVDIDGQWTKRIALYTTRRALPRTALRAVRTGRTASP